MEKTLRRVFSELAKHGVLLEDMILKPSMVTSGIDNPNQVDSDTVAKATIRCFKRTVPAAVPGMAFLSGGQSSEMATAHLAGQGCKQKTGPANSPSQSQM